MKLFCLKSCLSNYLLLIIILITIFNLSGCIQGVYPDDHLSVSNNERNDYLIALGLFEDGLYQSAELRLQDFLYKYPTSEWRESAYYLLGKSQFYLKKYSKVCNTIKEFMVQFPSSTLVDDAVFLIGESYYEEKDYMKAISTFQSLIDAFPNSELLNEAIELKAICTNNIASEEAQHRIDKQIQTGHPLKETKFIKDYFIPSNGNNKSVYYSTYPETGERTGMSEIEWFKNNSDGTYEVMSANFFNDQTNSILVKIIKITDDEIKIIKTTSTTMSETNRDKTYYPARVYLKTPKDKIKSTWEYTDQKEETYICSSEWAVVNIDGQNKKTIKVTRQLKDNIFSKFIVSEYYVKGIGLWKTTLHNEQDIEPNVQDIKLLDYQEYEQGW